MLEEGLHHKSIGESKEQEELECQARMLQTGASAKAGTVLNARQCLQGLNHWNVLNHRCNVEHAPPLVSGDKKPPQLQALCNEALAALKGRRRE